MLPMSYGLIVSSPVCYTKGHIVLSTAFTQLWSFNSIHLHDQARTEDDDWLLVSQTLQIRLRNYRYYSQLTAWLQVTFPAGRNCIECIPKNLDDEPWSSWSLEAQAPIRKRILLLFYGPTTGQMPVVSFLILAFVLIVFILTTVLGIFTIALLLQTLLPQARDGSRTVTPTPQKEVSNRIWCSGPHLETFAML